MLKKLFAATLLLIASTAANAEIMQGINGSFGVGGFAATTLDLDGDIVAIDFSDFSFIADEVVVGDYQPYISSSSIINYDVNPLILADLTIGDTLFNIDGFTFDFISFTQTTDAISNGLRIIGDVSHVDFFTTETEWFFSIQGLTAGNTGTAIYSSTITSPAPLRVAVPVPEPGTLAIFAVGLVALSLRRKKKTV